MIIRNIWCVGRNYQAHAKEMNAATPSPHEAPIIFLKAGSAATVGANEIWLPHWATQVDHELELALRWDQFLRVKEAALALDLTERRLQSEAKQKGLPWTLAKSFEEACPITPTFLIESWDRLKQSPFRLWVNDELRQEGRAQEMIHPIEKLITYVEEHFPVCGGDFLLTGTPAGVGPLKSGDTVKVQLEGEITHIWKVQQHPAPKEE